MKTNEQSQKQTESYWPTCKRCREKQAGWFIKNTWYNGRQPEIAVKAREAHYCKGCCHEVIDERNARDRAR